MNVEKTTKTHPSFASYPPRTNLVRILTLSCPCPVPASCSCTHFVPCIGSLASLPHHAAHLLYAELWVLVPNSSSPHQAHQHHQQNSPVPSGYYPPVPCPFPLAKQDPRLLLSPIRRARKAEDAQWVPCARFVAGEFADWWSAA